MERNKQKMERYGEEHSPRSMAGMLGVVKW
ncbi:not available [Yersinia enterocolitica]|nr:not available [Yersinia enterocolitica]UXD29744.1 not available [Yersinia enterocolitica]